MSVARIWILLVIVLVSNIKIYEAKEVSNENILSKVIQNILRINNTLQKFVKDFKKDNVDISTLPISEEDTDINKEAFKTSILRKAYENACLRLAIKRCYIACTKVVKTSCISKKCKSKIKKQFKEKSKTGCIKAFVKNNTDSKAKVNETSNVKATSSDDSSSIDNRRDISRELMVLSQQRKPSNKSATKSISHKSPRGLSILRAKYEKQCDKTSRKKCVKACLYARSETCAEHKCEKSLKKTFKKNCKRQCKIAYQSVRATSKSTSDSTSSSESESSLSLSSSISSSSSSS